MTNEQIIQYIKENYKLYNETYFWSSFILPTGEFIAPENDDYDDYGEHANIIAGVAENCFNDNWYKAEQWLEQNCVKCNVTYPYIDFPSKPTKYQYYTAEDWIDGMFENESVCCFDIVGADDDGYTSNMEYPLYVSLYGKSGHIFDIAVYNGRDITDRVKKASASGILEENICENNMIKIKFTDYAEPYMRGTIYEMESDFAPHERDWNNDGEVYTDLLSVFKLVDREGNVDRFGPKPPNKLPLTKGAYDDLLRSGQIQIVGSEVQQKDYKKMAIDYLNGLTMESLLKENTLEEFGPYSISAGYTKTIKWGTVGLFDVEYKDRTVYISDWIESEEELKYKVDKAITKINTLKESLERVMKFTVVAYNKDADTYVDLFTTEDVHEAIVEAEKNAYLCLRDRLRDKDGEPFDWIEVVDERDKVYWASYDDFVPEVGAILTRERFDALVSNGDKTGHLATPSHNFIYYPDRGIVVTDRANPKKSTTIHIEDVKKGYDHIRDIDADKVLTESFRKGLNEGPGAGYTITSKGYNMQGSVSDVISVVYTDKGYVIKALCDFVGEVKEFKADSYYSGTGDVENLPIHCDSFEIRIPLDNDEVIEQITNGAKEITKDNIDVSYLEEAVLDVLYTSECSFVYGGGYTHSKYDGQVNDYDHLEYDPYYFDDIKATIYLTNQEDIDKVDRMTQGYGYETYYEVEQSYGDYYEEWFDDEDEAIKYAKENGCLSVRALYTTEDWEGNTNAEMGETIWENDEVYESLKEGGLGSGDRRTATQRYNDRADKIFQGKKNLDRAQAEYLRRLGVSEEEIIDLTNRDRLQVKLIELGEKDNFYNKYDFKSGVLKESYNENSPKIKLTMNNFDSYDGGDTASYTVDNVDTIKPYIIDIGYKTTFKFSDDLYQIKQDDIKKVEVVAMTQDDIYRTDVDVQVYIDIDDNMDLIYCGTYTDSNDVKDVAMVEKIVNDWMRTGKTVKTIKEDFMMEGDGVKDYNKLFSEFLELIDFQLVENGDDSYTDANGDVHDGKWSLIDLQGGNIGGIEARRYTNAADIIEDLDIYIDDYIFNPIIDSLKDVGIQSSYSDYRILRYRDELPDSEWDFDVLDMIANHEDEIDLEKVEHNGFLPVEESLKDSKEKTDDDKEHLGNPIKKGLGDETKKVIKEGMRHPEVEPIKFEITLDRDKNEEHFEEIEDMLGAEEVYGGYIEQIKNIVLYQYPEVYSDSVSVEYQIKFDALVYGDFDEDGVESKWIRFNTLDMSGNALTVNAWYDDGAVCELADTWNAGESYCIVESICNMLESAKYESIYDVSDILYDYVDDPEYDEDDEDIEESLKEDNRIPRNATKVRGVKTYGDDKGQSIEFTRDGSIWRGKDFITDNRTIRKYYSDFEVVETDPNYKPKRTEEVYVVQGNYGNGWDDLTQSSSYKEAKADLKSYDENESYPHRLITRRVPIEESLKESMTELEFFPGDEGDLDAEEYVNEQGLTDCSYEIEWDDVRKGYVLSVESELPKEVELSIYEVGYVDGETDANELDEKISDYLSDNYGYCHNGFQFDVDGDTIYIYDIKWDMTESLKDDKSEVVDTLYDVNTLDYENDKLYKKNIEHYDTYTDYDEALETYKELSHESFYPHVELCQVDVYEDGHRDYKVIKSTYGNELVEDFDQEQDTAWTKDEICAEIKSLTSNFTAKNGEAKTFFDEEKDFAVACLEENGYTVTADKQGGKWVIVYKKQVKEHVAVDRYDQLNKDNAKGVIQINATPSGKVLKENAEDYKATLLSDTKKAIERDKKLLDVARREAANDPKHKAYYDKMIADLESHIAYNEERVEKLSKEETKVDFADSMNSRTFDSAMSYRDIENRKSLEDADKVKPDIIRKGQPGYDNLEYAAMIATEKSPRGFTYTLGDTYLDFGSGWQWTTLIADKNNGRDSYQALNQVEWEEIANAESNEVIDRVIDDMFKDQYCPDRISRRVESVEDALLRLDMMD